MRSSSGITGIVRVGSAWRAHFTSPDTGQRVFSPTFADKWAAAQWREAAIEGRVPTVRTTLFDQFSPDRIALACTERGLTGRRAAALQGGARWLRSQCRDLLEVDPADAAAVRQALDSVLNRRKYAAPDPRKVAQHWRLVGRWELRDGDLWRDGEPVTIRATTPRPIRLAVEPALAVVPVTRLRAGILQGVLDRVARQHPDPDRTVTGDTVGARPSVARRRD